VLQRLDVLNQIEFCLGGVVAQGAVEGARFRVNGDVNFLKVSEELHTCFMPIVTTVGVSVKLVSAISVIIAGIATKLDGVADIHVFQPPLILFATFSDVVEKLQFLLVLVRLHVELEVGLHLCCVVAESTLLDIPNDDAPQLLIWFTTIPRDVLLKFTQTVSAELVANRALVQPQWFIVLEVI
jgi:hypothetical protein